jgi:segregation and condensation protein A
MMTETREPETEAGSGEEGERRGDSYEIRVGQFEGPLDLLLHLVRINEVDVTDIPIVEITKQYNRYLGLMQEMNLEIAGEYLVMAATLMHIKSRMLLPPDPADAEGEEEQDPRAELAQQLLEYQKFKQAAETLQAMDSRRSLIWTRDDYVPDEFAGEELLTVDLFDLISSFQKLISRLDEEERLRLRKDTVSVAEKITWLTDLLEERRSVALFTLLEGLPTLQDRIAVFLAILEMLRLRMIVAFQRKHLDEIRIAIRPDSGSAGKEGEQP